MTAKRSAILKGLLEVAEGSVHHHDIKRVHDEHHARHAVADKVMKPAGTPAAAAHAAAAVPATEAKKEAVAKKLAKFVVVPEMLGSVFLAASRLLPLKP